MIDLVKQPKPLPLMTVALKLTLTDAYFDKALSVGTVRLVDRLEAFDKDLSFVRATTKSKQSIVEEMTTVVDSEDPRRPLEQMVELFENQDPTNEQLFLQIYKPYLMEKKVNASFYLNRIIFTSKNKSLRR